MAATIWKGYLSFGLISIPVKLFRAARAEKIHVHRLERATGGRVRQVFVPANTEQTMNQMPPRPASAAGPSLVAAKKQPEQQPLRQTSSQEIKQADPDAAALVQNLAPTEIVRGFEFEKGKYVAFEPEELDQIAPQTSPDMQVIEFVRFREVDPVYLETSYHISPDKGGEKPYALLFETLKKTGYAAIAEFVMHRRDQTMIMRPGKDGIIGHTLFYEDEIKQEYAFHADTSLVASKEMELAEKLVEALATPFDPAKFKDKFRERLQNAISAKVEGGASSAVEPVGKGKSVVDIMEALQASLKAIRKPVVSALKSETNKTTPKKKSSGK